MADTPETGRSQAAIQNDTSFLSASQPDEVPEDVSPAAELQEDQKGQGASLLDDVDHIQSEELPPSSNVLSQLGIPTDDVAPTSETGEASEVPPTSDDIAENNIIAGAAQQDTSEGSFEPTTHTKAEVEHEVDSGTVAAFAEDEQAHYSFDEAFAPRTEASQQSFEALLVDDTSVEPNDIAEHDWANTDKPVFGRSDSPGEKLFDQIVHDGEQPVQNDGNNDNWMGEEAPIPQKDFEAVHDTVGREAVPLLADADPPQETPAIFKDESTDPFFNNEAPAPESDLDWMQTDGNDQTGAIVENHDLNDVQTFPDDGIEGTEGDLLRASLENEPAPDFAPFEDQPGDQIEDSWASAFDAGDLDDTWDNAFSSGLDEDGFLADTEEPAAPATSDRYGPAAPDTRQKASSISQYQQTSAARPVYAPSLPTQPSVPQQQERAKPMEFFAELPSTNVRSRKTQRSVPTTTQPTPPPPPSSASFGQSSGPRPPSSSSSYQAFAGPGRLPLFPAQPSVPPPQPIASSSPQPLPSAVRQTSPVSSRYSPAPTQPVPLPPQQQAYPPTSAPQQSSPPQSQPRGRQPATLAPPSSQTAAPRQRSPYAPAPGQGARRPSPYAKPPSQTGTASAPLQPSGNTTSKDISPSPSRYPPARSSSRTSQAPATRLAQPPQTVPEQSFFEDLPPPPPHRFAPRTSSPLAQPSHERPLATRNMTMPIQSHELMSQPDHARHQSLGDEADKPAMLSAQRSAPPAATGRYSPSPNRPAGQQPAPAYPSHMFPSASDNANRQQSETSPGFRLQTSSPTRARHVPPQQRQPIERPASAHIMAPPPSGFSASTRMARTSMSRGSELDFVKPTDETAHDPLQRWQGCPIFRWGPAGSILTCSPQRIPRYGGGQSAPKLKCLPGEPRLQKAKDLLGDEFNVTSFPGPLKSKSKKKEVVAWLGTTIEAMERQQQDPQAISHDESRSEEQTLLWKCMKVFVENDGQLSGNSTVDAAVRAVLLQTSDEPQAPASAASTTSQLSETTPHAAVVQEIKQALLRGEREKAVWLATDNKLWSHAMLISSTLNKDIWKQVVQEFVRKDVRSPDQPNHSLAALYEVFAGDWEDSIDQLVPVSARSGFQMVSTADRGSQPRDAMEGLSKWRETIGLILSNRSVDDEKALLAMGKLLSSYGRVEAAHICYIFARSMAQFGGADDPQTSFALLGFDHSSADTVVGLDAILLTEVYEFGLSLAPTTASSSSPHLQAYKLRHAYALAELGQQTEALAYCDVIATSIGSKTRVSHYYHAALLSQLDDLQKRLTQSPKDGSSSWIKTKPTMSKMSSGMSKWFNTFVEGDDDAASNGSGYDSGAEAGPFIRNLGGTPSLSRSGSATDFFGADFARSLPQQFPQQNQLSAPTNSRYAPPAAYGSRPSFETESIYSSSPEQRQGIYSPRMNSDSPSNQYGSPPSTSYSGSRHPPSGLSQLHSYQPDQGSLPSQTSYVPTVQEEPAIAAYPAQDSVAEEKPADGYIPTINGGVSAYGGYQPYAPEYGVPTEQDQPQQGYVPSATSDDLPQPTQEPQTTGYAPQSSSYDPSGGYDPNAGYTRSSYEPAPPSPDGVDDSPKPKKKMFGDEDEDDDLVARASALKISQKSANDRATDDAFAAAAAADAARDKNDKRATSGWFKGISLNPFGAKKDVPDMPKVHKAKLGEQNSFYYDNEAKRWVNKAAGATTPEASAPTPPPPKMGPPMGSGPPSRAPSGSGGPPMGEPPTSAPALSLIPEGATPSSRTGTPGSVDGGDVPLINAGLGLTSNPSTSSTPPVTGPPGLAPPSRPGTGMSGVSNASSLDDLIAPRKGGTVKKGKNGGSNRYVDVMAK